MNWKSVAKVGGLGIVVLAAWAYYSADKVANAGATYDPQVVARGEYLVTAAGCNDCHTPLKMTPEGPMPDMSRMLSGHPEGLKLPPPPKPADGYWIITGGATMTAWAGPWGVTYTPNLTPDENTGLGIWTEDMFIRAMRTGKHMGTSRQIQPPMPWMNVGKLTDEDLKAVFAYLRSIPPIVNHVPEYAPPAEADE